MSSGLHEHGDERESEADRNGLRDEGSTFDDRRHGGSLAGSRALARWPSRLGAVYNAAHPQEPTARRTNGTRATPVRNWKLNVVAEGGFLMLDPVGQGVLCG